MSKPIFFTAPALLAGVMLQAQVKVANVEWFCTVCAQSCEEAMKLVRAACLNRQVVTR